jgi:hypothetical protein
MKSEKLRTSKTQRLGRGLAFEQMESRLALSTTIGIDTTTGLELQWDRTALLAVYQGGFVNFGLRIASDQVTLQGAGSLVEAYPQANAILKLWHDDLDFTVTCGFDASDVTTIAQPGIGPIKSHGGMIAIGEIFAVAPLVKMGNNPAEVAQTVRGQLENTDVSITTSEEQLSLTRGRDVYFEVAARVEDGNFERPTRPDRTEASVASAQLGSDEELNQNSASVSIAALAARGRSLPAAQSSLPSEPVQIRESAQPLREAPSVSQTPQPNETDKTPQPKQVSKVEVHDQVFQVWQDSKLDVTKRVVGRPAEEEQDETANWPVLAALAVGGMVFSSRQPGSSAPSQRQPPTRKPLGFSRPNR